VFFNFVEALFSWNLVIPKTGKNCRFYSM